MSRKHMKIAFTHGGIIPAKVLKTAKDKSVSPFEPVKVPEAYGLQLISDKHAFDHDAWEKQRRADEAAAAERADEAKNDAAKDDRIAELGKQVETLTSELATEREKVSNYESGAVEMHSQVTTLTADLEAERAKTADLEQELANLIEAKAGEGADQAGLPLDGETPGASE